MANIIKSGELNPNYRHGLSRHPLGAVRQQMIARCTKKTHPRYSDYGGRGIKVCDEWISSYVTFYKWCLENGWSKGLQLDRRNNDGGYNPENCRFVTRTVNVRNSRHNIFITYKGETKALSEWCEVLKLSYPAMQTRVLRHNPTPEVLFETPSRYHKHLAKMNKADGRG